MSKKGAVVGLIEIVTTTIARESLLLLATTDTLGTRTELGNGSLIGPLKPLHCI
jgi:hypothetical protein